MSTPESEPGFASITPHGSTWVNRVTARVLLTTPPYRPGRAARRVRCPILFCVCEHDSVAPSEKTLQWARSAPRGEIRRYPCGHFAIYTDEAFELAIADQTAFLRRVLID